MRKEVDAVVLMNAVEPSMDSCFFYATGLVTGLFEGCVAILEPRRTEVLTSELEALSASEAGVKTTVFENGQESMRLMAKKLSRFSKIGINARELTVANHRKIRKASKGAKLIDVSQDLYRARMIKQPDELARIRKACAIASKTCVAIPEMVNEGMTETEVAAELNYRMMRLGANATAFDSNVAFGAKSAEPHYFPSPTRRLKKGQFALFDFGASYKRYVSDITRTFICHSSTKRQREMHETVLRAQEAAIDSIVDGVSGATVDDAARKVIDSSEFRGLFIHSTGHGIGISVHDPGSISSANDMTLLEGMVLTVEPGVYIKGYGGVRIEDDVLVTKSGCRVLTSCPKELRSI
ncbi:MAG: Xaa-Pro peptidase family protein [Thermoplasmata archaeon]|nr:Xaa-Pro peptidase family protein [Thermoplasmata archaeon]